ncbi:MAG: BamA/TamA family outer membrane protein, partial [Flavobacteriales bacterium]
MSSRLKWPDDFFINSIKLSYQQFNLDDFRGGFIFNDGTSNKLSLKLGLKRNSLSQSLYPRYGSRFKLSSEATLPASFFDGGSLFKYTKDYANLPLNKRFNWIEYHKWKFTGEWFTKIFGNGDYDMVLRTKVGFGFLQSYNSNLKSPFQRFELGGSGLTGFRLQGEEIIALRGYDDGALSPPGKGTIISKYTAELRFPITLGRSSSIYLLTFAEAGKSWNDFEEFAPFDVNRSVGAGIRIFLPAFGMLGIDYGIGLDPNEYNPNFQPGSGQI